MILCDLHTHSNRSFDAENSVDEMCRAAVARGLSAIAVTDHCEAPYINCGDDCEFGSFDKQIPASLRDAREARERYRGELNVLCGMELGEPMHDPEQTARALEYGDFDFILASVHNLRGRDDFYYMDFSSVDLEEVLCAYFDELLETASFPHFDSLAHLTYPLRYVYERTGSVPDLTPYLPRIEAIFQTLIQNRKALEINVSGLFKPMTATLPPQELVTLFRRMGGQYITIGTDAHRADMVGKGIKEGLAVAQKAGFSHYTVYQAHTPQLIPIE